MKLRAVLFDLDDTLYPERAYVASGFAAVGQALEARFGIPDADSVLLAAFAEDPKDVYGRVLRAFGKPDTPDVIGRLTEIYRAHKPRLDLPQETKDALRSLRAGGKKLGLLTDGEPPRQRAKIEALGLSDAFDAIVITDELGGAAFRKPHPAGFRTACERLGVAPEETVYVGDNPQKDFAVKRDLPIVTVQLVRADGLYGACAYAFGIRPDRVVGGLGAVCALTEEWQ